MAEIKEWVADFVTPKFTDDEFERKKARYVSEKGYAVEIPGVEDIIHIRGIQEPTDEEFKLWRKKDREALGDKRFDDITRLVKTKRERYERMLRSPTPGWMRNIASVLTALDDINDLLLTIGVICRFLVHFAPKWLARFLLGPIGWIFLLADLFAFLAALLMAPVTCLVKKRGYEKMGDVNPFSKKSRMRRARRLGRLFPSWRELIQMLQTTDQLFGIGVCLGPIMGFIQDLIFGTYRVLAGEKVEFDFLPQAIPDHVAKASRALQTMVMLALADQELTEEEHFNLIVAQAGAMQIVEPYIREYNPIDHVEGLQHAEIRAPQPWAPTTKYVLEQAGIPPGTRTGWVGLDKEWTTFKEIWDTYKDKASEQLMDYIKRNIASLESIVAAQLANELGLRAASITEFPEKPVTELEDQWHRWLTFFNTGCQLIRAD